MLMAAALSACVALAQLEERYDYLQFRAGRGMVETEESHRVRRELADLRAKIAERQAQCAEEKRR